MDEMLTTAELIFEGRVLASEARWLADGSTIKTFVLFEVQDIVSGDYSDKTLTLSFEGGTVGDDSISIAGINLPTVGEKGIYFVEKLGLSFINPIVGWSQGHFLLKNDGSGKEIVTTQNEILVIDMDVKSVINDETPDSVSTSGIANGIQVSKSGSNSAMTSTNFKQALKQRLIQINNIQ